MIVKSNSKGYSLYDTLVVCFLPKSKFGFKAAPWDPPNRGFIN